MISFRLSIPCALLLGASLLACSKAGDDTSRPGEHAAADNTKKNERDQQPGALTPMDQGGSDANRSITQEVRQNVVKDDALSMTAKNIKIITVNGVVTLRGPVKSAQEKTAIETIAQHAGHVTKVDNQLEIASN